MSIFSRNIFLRTDVNSDSSLKYHDPVAWQYLRNKVDAQQHAALYFLWYFSHRDGNLAIFEFDIHFKETSINGFRLSIGQPDDVI